MLETVKEAKIGSIVPLYKELDEEIDAFDYFAKLSNNGKKKHSLFFQHNGNSFGSASPCLVITGKGENFEIKAFNETGKRFLAFIKKDFGFCDKATYNRDRIHGSLSQSNRAMSEDQRLKAKTHIDIVRTVAYKFKPKTGLKVPYSGVLGMVSPMNRDQESLDYVFYFMDNMFLVDHNAKKTYFISNALITDNKKDKVYTDSNKILNSYEKLAAKKAPKPVKGKKKKFEVSYETDKDQLFLTMKTLKKQIIEGNILYANVSSKSTCNYYGDPLVLYESYKKMNEGIPSYYINHEEGISISAAAGTRLVVSGDNEKEILFTVVTSKKPRGKGKDETDNDLDNKYEALLKADENEIAKHTMLADTARNEIAKISMQGRYMEKFFSDDKDNNNHNLTLSVKGILKDGLDALHAYYSTLNFWIGVTKNNALSILQKMEKHDRGFHSGSIVMASIEGNLHSVSIDSLSLKKDKVAVLAGSDVFYNSNDEDEADQNSVKVQKVLDMVKETGGLK